MESPEPDGDPALREISDRYRRFAEQEARDRSSLYEQLALEVSQDSMALGFLAELPSDKQQPNLLFATVKFLHGSVPGWDEFRIALLRDGARIADVMRRQKTQTNEPARCATLLPLLATLRQPIALIEVGAAAGLCLLPDFYRYDFGGHRIAAIGHGRTEPPEFECAVNDITPIPSENVEVVWRSGLDLAPIDLHDDGQVGWLEALVWPGEGNRLDQLRSAVALGREQHLDIRQGDLLRDLPVLVDEAPTEATLVVFHSAVLPYVPSEQRAAFSRFARDRLTTWIANEHPSLQPRAAERLSANPPARGEFLLSLNERPVAWADPHGSRLEWLRSLPP